jgi:hypothetical protein
LSARLPPAAAAPVKQVTARMNFAVNNDGDYFPRLTASYVAPRTSLSKLIDGNYWYHKDPPNRWTCEGSASPTDWVEIDLGMPRRVDTVKLYVLDDGEKVVAPANYELQSWDGAVWKAIAGQKHPEAPAAGHRPETVTFPATDVQRLRVVLTHAKTGKAGLTELEIWGDAVTPFTPAPPPAGNLAFNAKREGFPKASASFSDRYGGTPDKAIDGRIIFLPTPMNRWTSYGSPSDTDWLEVDFGAEKEVDRVVLHIYDDRGGVQPPEKYVVQAWSGTVWRDVDTQVNQPATPTGGMANTATFKPVKTSKIRVLFTHKGKARSGVTEVEAWRE